MLTIKVLHKRMHFYAQFLERLCLFLVGVVTIFFLLRWCQDLLPIVKNGSVWFPSSTGTNTLGSYNVDTLRYLRNMPLASRALLILVDGIEVAIVILGLFMCRQLMSYFKNAEVFSLRTIGLLRKISIVALVWALYSPFNVYMMSSFAFHETDLMRGLSLGYAVDTMLIKFVFFGFLLIIAIMIQEGWHLKNEQDLTV